MKALLAKAASAAKSTFSAATNVVGQAVAKVTGAATTAIVKAVAPYIPPKVVAAAAAVVQVVAKTVVAKAVGSAQQVAAKSANSAKNAAIATANTLKAAAAKAKDMGTKAVGSPVVQCPLALYSKYSPEINATKSLTFNVVKWGTAKVGVTKSKTFTLTGAKTILRGPVSFGGHFGAGKMFTKIATSGTRLTAGIGAAIGLGKEAVEQYQAKQLDKTRLGAAAFVGATKAVAGKVAFAIGVAGAVALGGAGFVPIVAGIGLTLGVSYLLDKADQKYDFTTKTTTLFKKVF